jgi:hypothetical protein
MEVCKAIIQVGSRKGQRCMFPPGESLYCGRHIRNKKYDEGIEEGKSWCRFFFRGCDNYVTGDTTCKECKDKLFKNKKPCKHEGCKFKTEEDFCKKHERDKYYLEEKEKNIKYCDIARGCFTIVIDKQSCEACLEVKNIKSKERLDARRSLLKIAENINTTTRSCIKCTKDFEVFKTKHGKDSFNCRQCSEKQANNDKKREDRNRNYKKERLDNLEISYKSHITKTLQRGYGDFKLTFEEFKKLVSSPCNYCKIYNAEEANGIDRVNNDLGYTKENCVSACWKCNRIKHFYHPDFFIEKCKIISKEIQPTKDFYLKWSTYYTRSCNNNYTNYKKESEQTRGLPFDITQSQWDWLTRSPCYLCGYQDSHGIGLDRVDNTDRKYTFENSRPCCGSCNSMKSDIILEDFINHCKIISNNWPSGSFISIPICKNPLKKEERIIIENRTHWKSRGLLYAILSNSASIFQESYKDVLSIEEFEELSILVKGSSKEDALSILQTLLNKLKKRKYRQKLNGGIQQD